MLPLCSSTFSTNLIPLSLVSSIDQLTFLCYNFNMVLLYSSIVLKESNKQAGKTARPRKAPISKKRKAQEAMPMEEEKDNLPLAAPAELEESKGNATPLPPEPKEYERTPGRVGLSKRHLSPSHRKSSPLKAPLGRRSARRGIRKRKSTSNLQGKTRDIVSMSMYLSLCSTKMLY